MYVPPAFAESRPAVLHELIRANPFATLVSTGDAGAPVVTHLPLLLDADRGPHGTLVGHVARVNEHAALIAAGRPVLAIFHGPHAYVSPRWYATSPSVPTWNYAVVHAAGTPRALSDEDDARRVLEAVTRAFEPAEGGWTMDGLSPAYVRSMTAGIVAFEVPIDRLEGKFKLSQNRPAADRAGVVAALSAGAAGDRDTAALMASLAARA
ncbi:MAG TPA: FMN-binding negative transcriptional regulator [Humisphaera sp.]